MQTFRHGFLAAIRRFLHRKYRERQFHNETSDLFKKEQRRRIAWHADFFCFFYSTWKKERKMWGGFIISNFIWNIFTNPIVHQHYSRRKKKRPRKEFCGCISRIIVSRPFELTLRSLWTMCFWWQYCTADTICEVGGEAEFSQTAGFCALRRWQRMWFAGEKMRPTLTGKIKTRPAGPKTTTAEPSRAGFAPPPHGTVSLLCNHLTNRVDAVRSCQYWETV